MPTNGQFAVGEMVTSIDANTLFAAGRWNRIINGHFLVNQRSYASGTNLASGSYGFDRWKSGYTNTALTFTAGSQSTTVTISTSGVIQQIVEQQFVPAGEYVLSWSGTATGRVYNSGAGAPSYAASPIVVSLDGTANVVVEFTASGGTKTLGLVQLEPGNVYGPFQYRPRAIEDVLCERYYQTFTFRWQGNTTTSGYRYPVFFRTRMRSTPTATLGSQSASGVTNVALDNTTATETFVSFSGSSTGDNRFLIITDSTLAIEL